MQNKIIKEPEHIKNLTDFQICQKAGLPDYVKVIDSTLSLTCFELCNKLKITTEYVGDYTVCYPFQNTDAQKDNKVLYSVSDINPCKAVLMAAAWKEEVLNE